MLDCCAWNRVVSGHSLGGFSGAGKPVTVRPSAGADSGDGDRVCWYSLATLS